MGNFLRLLLLCLLAVGVHHTSADGDESPEDKSEDSLAAVPEKGASSNNTGDELLRSTLPPNEDFLIENDTSCYNTTADDLEAETPKQNTSESEPPCPASSSHNPPMEDSAQGPAQVRSFSSLIAPDSDCPTEKPASTSHLPQMAIQHRLSKSLSQLSELLQQIKVDCGPEEKGQQEKGAEGESAGEEPQKWLHDLQQRGYPQKWLHDLQQPGYPQKWLHDLQQGGYPQKWLHELEQYHLLKKALKNPKANGNQPEVPISPQLHATQGHQSQWHLSHPFPLHHEPLSQGIPSRDHLFYGSPLEKPWPKVSPEPQHYYLNPSFPMVPQLAQGFRPQLPVKPQQEHGFGFHPQREYGFQPMEPQYRNSLPVPVKRHDHGYGPISRMEPELPRQEQQSFQAFGKPHEHIYRPTLPLEPQMPKRQPQGYQGHRAARLLARWPNFLPQRPNYVVLAPGHTNSPNYKARQGGLPQRVHHVPV